MRNSRARWLRKLLPLARDRVVKRLWTKVPTSLRGKAAWNLEHHKEKAIAYGLKDKDLDVEVAGRLFMWGL